MYRIIFILTLLCFIKCTEGINQIHIVGRYYLTATDYEQAKQSLSFKADEGGQVDIVNAMVFSVAHHDKYIFAKQHPRTVPDPPDTTIVNYFIIPIYDEMTHWPEKNILGPLDEVEFQAEYKKLGFKEDIKFKEYIQ